MNFEKTRRARRYYRKNAAAVAKALAGSTAVLRADGALKIVSDPVGQAALCRGFEAVLRAGLEPQVISLSTDEGRALSPGAAAPAGARWWGGFGLDVEGRGTFATIWACGSGLSPVEAADLAEVRLLEILAPQLGTAGWEWR